MFKEIQTQNAGEKGSSGTMTIITGSASQGNGGSILVESGLSEHGKGGNITLVAGESNSKSYYPKFDGGSISLQAGHSETRAGVGGQVSIKGGVGKHKGRLDGGVGGSVSLVGGDSLGLDKKNSVGK